MIIALALALSQPPVGAINPLVVQANIHATICVPGWATKQRPPQAYSERLKIKQLRALHLKPLSAYEEDHLIPLSIGGAAMDVANLWPQRRLGRYGATAKDKKEALLHAAVCAGHTRLRTAQRRMQRWHRDTGK